MFFNLFTFMLFAVLVIAIAALHPPIYFHLGGSDASNYVNASLRYALGYPSAIRFYPPEIAAEHFALLDSVFLNSRDELGVLGMMAPFTFVSFDHRILWPHFHLYSFCVALFRAARFDVAAEYFNYAGLFACCCLNYLIARRLGVSKSLSLLAGGLVLLIPSYIMGARSPLSESLATVLTLGLVYCAVGRHRHWEWQFGILLSLLTWGRAEYTLLAVLYLCYLGLRREGRFLPLVLTLSASLIGLERYYLYINLGHADFVRLLLAIGRFGFLFYLLGELLARTSMLSKLDTARAWLLRSRPSVPGIVLVGVALILGVDFVKQVVCGGEGCFGFPKARYSTMMLLLDSVGAPILAMSVVGIVVRGRTIFQSAPPVLLVTLPLLIVFFSMTATPQNVWYWTRRFHVLVYPLVILGCVNFFLLLESYALRIQNHLLRQLLIPACIALLVVLPRLPAYSELPANPMTREFAAHLHGASATFPKEAIVVVDARRSPMLILQQPLRAFHGLWSYASWNGDKLGEAIEVLRATGRPVYLSTEQYNRLFPSEPSRASSIQVPTIQPDGKQISVAFTELGT